MSISRKVYFCIYFKCGVTVAKISNFICSVTVTKISNFKCSITVTKISNIKCSVTVTKISNNFTLGADIPILKRVGKFLILAKVCFHVF